MRGRKTPVRGPRPRAIVAAVRYLPGFDYGRAFFILAVVGWHTQVLGSARVLRPDEAGASLPVDVPGVIYLNVLLLAVPFFLTSSLVLYARARQAEDGRGRFARRLTRLAWLAGFWVAVWSLTRGIGHVDSGFAVQFVFSGGHSVFYFLIELCLLTAVMEAALRLGLADRPRATMALALLAALLPILRIPIADALRGHDAGLLAYWSPLNFLVYPFLALVVLQFAARRQLPRWWLVPALLGYVSLTVVEWALMVSGRAFATDGTVLSPYARPSVMLAAGVITLALLGVRREAPRAVRGLSDLSLGVYCVHPFLVVNGAWVFREAWATIEPRRWLLFLVAVVLSLALAYPLRRGLAS